MWGSVLECGGKCRGLLGEVWGSVLGCGGRCKEVLGEMWGEVWKSVGEGVGKI